MFRVKICGITRTEDALTAQQAGADAIGLNFYPGSKRYVAPDEARQIAMSVEDHIQRVGVFVNAPVEEIRHIYNSVGLSAVQLHGDEPPEVFSHLDGIPVVLAKRMPAGAFASLVQAVADCGSAGRKPDTLLVDAFADGEYGGTGHTVAWPELTEHRDQLGEIPLILAGGLVPDNVAEAITTVQPAGVDTASGVESSPGIKDPAKVDAFITAALRAFE